MRLEYFALAILVLQLAAAFWAFTLDPVIHQRQIAFLMSLNFVALALLAYVYKYKDRYFPKNVISLNEELIAIGIGAIALIALLIVFS